MSKQFTISGRVLTPDGIVQNGIVQIREGIIAAVGERGTYRGTIDYDAGSRLVAPGFIDIHVHGAVGHNFMTSEPHDKRGVVVADGSVRIKATGGLAGSCLTMNRAAKRMH
jgi:N-acetylglucosamine-6-phosphate deacetylase